MRAATKDLVARVATKDPVMSSVKSMRDRRITHLLPLGEGEGFTTYLAAFTKKPAIVVDSGMMNDFLDEADRIAEPVSILMFDSVEERDDYVADNALMLGRRRG